MESNVERKTVHMHASIAGLLQKSDKFLRDLFLPENGKPLQAPDIRLFLNEQLAEGKRVIPVGDCDNFDYQTGCQGHPPRLHGPEGYFDRLIKENHMVQTFPGVYWGVCPICQQPDFRIHIATPWKAAFSHCGVCGRIYTPEAELHRQMLLQSGVNQKPQT